MENGTAEEYAFLNDLEDEFNLETSHPTSLLLLEHLIQVFLVIKLVD